MCVLAILLLVQSACLVQIERVLVGHHGEPIEHENTEFDHWLRMRSAHFCLATFFGNCSCLSLL